MDACAHLKQIPKRRTLTELFVVAAAGFPQQQVIFISILSVLCVKTYKKSTLKKICIQFHITNYPDLFNVKTCLCIDVVCSDANSLCDL